MAGVRATTSPDRRGCSRIPSYETFQRSLGSYACYDAEWAELLRIVWMSR